MDTTDKCIVCQKRVKGEQHAMQCDKCDRWTHRLCGTGISLQTYRSIMRGEVNLDFNCHGCADIGCPETESTRLSEIENVSSVPSVTFGNFSIGSAPLRSPTPSPPASPTISPDASPIVMSRRRSIPLNYSSDESVRNESFNISRSYLQPEVHNEMSIQENTITNVQTDHNDEITYQIVENASQRGQPKLSDNTDFSYNRKRKRGAKVDWQCTVRNSNTKCPATVVQHGDMFTRGKSGHNHPALPGVQTAIKITAQVKQMAKENVFQSATAIVESTYLDHANPSQPEASRPAQSNLVRIANRARERLRPQEPKSLDFEIAQNFILQDFLKKDIVVEGQRHLIFATYQQLQNLSKATTWYLDGTFKIVRQPFTQLFSIHSFIRQGEEMKQVPLLFCLMSRRRTKDYKKVLRHVRKLLPSPPVVKEVVTDFERAIWNGIQANFPDVRIRGCSYHWTQAIWRKVQELGLQVAYQNDDSIFNFVRKVMALPFLPEEHILPAFQKLKCKANADKIVSLMEYVESNWIQSDRGISSWCVYNQSVRTNNDVEGWHRRMNHKSRDASPPFYVLIPLLHSEANLLPIQLKLVSEGKLRRFQRSKSIYIQRKLFSLWGSYDNDEMSTSQLLRKCAKLNGPVID